MLIIGKTIPGARPQVEYQADVTILRREKPLTWDSKPNIHLYSLPSFLHTLCAFTSWTALESPVSVSAFLLFRKPKSYGNLSSLTIPIPPPFPNSYSDSELSLHFAWPLAPRHLKHLKPWLPIFEEYVLLLLDYKLPRTFAHIPSCILEINLSYPPLPSP